MTLSDLKKVVDSLVLAGYGEWDIVMEFDPIGDGNYDFAKVENLFINTSDNTIYISDKTIADELADTMSDEEFNAAIAVEDYVIASHTMATDF